MNGPVPLEFEGMGDVCKVEVYTKRMGWEELLGRVQLLPLLPVVRGERGVNKCENLLWQEGKKVDETRKREEAKNHIR